jgi:hypothetical protein
VDFRLFFRGFPSSHHPQELIFAPSSDGTAPPTAANAGTADVVPEVAVETSSSTIAPLVEESADVVPEVAVETSSSTIASLVAEKKERGNSSDLEHFSFFHSVGNNHPN